MPKITAMKEGVSFSTIMFDTVFHIGRKENGNQLVIPDKEIAKRHVTLKEINGRFYIIDRGAPKGVFLDEKRVKAKKILDGEHYILSPSYSIEIEMESNAFREEEGDIEQEDEFATMIPVQTARLVVTDGPMLGKRFQLDQDLVVIGRHKCSDILLHDDDPEIAAGFSRQHAEVMHEGEEYTLEVLSENGLVLEGMKYEEGAQFSLKHNISFTIGSVTFRFENPAKVLN